MCFNLLFCEEIFPKFLCISNHHIGYSKISYNFIGQLYFNTTIKTLKLAVKKYKYLINNFI